MQCDSIAFFDVDHTISRRATALAFALICMKRHYIKWWYFLLVPFLYIFYRLFSFKIENLYSFALPFLRGKTRDEIEDIGKEAFELKLKNDLYPGASREIEKLRSEGKRIVLATSTPFEAVYPLAQYYGISSEDIIATQFSYVNDVFTGRLAGAPVFSRIKRDIINTFAQRGKIDLQFCSFYTDSIHDLPLLEIVGDPVAANPDWRLRRIARRRGWSIKDFSK
ncbi:HAD-IB family hydrolase [Brucepastera parasyntrophica]|uniref:HAD family hydrolase n=1 Tax=Brucepastera parasyntrophica TaxID=2880008 RepID=UPI00210C3732|nr:HAD-IB family hydrolase [Brucepastera parasyntrophica]ULQ58856.1 HAD-IB family hydrolase [Brucepastera parasyntrophica]